jgi:hypothetical protein
MSYITYSILNNTHIYAWKENRNGLFVQYEYAGFLQKHIFATTSFAAEVKKRE